MATSPTDKHSQRLEQHASSIGLAAEMASHLGAGTAAPSVILTVSALAEAATSLACASEDNAPSCQQVLKIAFFFDGTGNNLDADLGSGEHSNVARLFRAHTEDDELEGIFKIYIPGIGTYFRDRATGKVIDEGGTARGLAFADGGEDRLKWAMERLQARIAEAKARATNPNNPIRQIDIALFGFSRGAALARAFAIRLQEECEPSGVGFRWKDGAYPFSIYFLGIFDTVASVGLPTASNHTIASGLVATGAHRAGLGFRSADYGMDKLAFGDPGADPAPGLADGHGAWAKDLRIPPLVKRTVHMAAAHETRNSFPLDSARNGHQYPEGCVEMVYPGVHSDIGGGYRVGEGARSLKEGSQLSLISLRAMYQEAQAAAVPVVGFAEMRGSERADFALEGDAAAEYQLLTRRFEAYTQHAIRGGQPLGAVVLSHMRLYYLWRFYKIRLNEAQRQSKQDTQDAAQLKQLEAEWAKERQALEAEMAPLEKEYTQARNRHNMLMNRRRIAEQRGLHNHFEARRLDEEIAQAETRFKVAEDPYLSVKARYDTLPGTQGALAESLEIYDQQLLKDARALQYYRKFYANPKMRPHYQALLEAYEAEFPPDGRPSRGLRDPDVIDFFDHYVHDSLAGFATDATLPSDPRVIYISGDTKMQYAYQAPHLNTNPLEVTDVA